MLEEHAAVLKEQGAGSRAQGGPSEHGASSGGYDTTTLDSWSRQAGRLFRQLAVPSVRRGQWPGLEEVDMVGVRQASRLYELPHLERVGGGLLGVLPLAQFPNGHSYWVQSRKWEALHLTP